jgi:hypothetical protein
MKLTIYVRYPGADGSDVAQKLMFRSRTAPGFPGVKRATWHLHDTAITVDIGDTDGDNDVLVIPWTSIIYYELTKP